MIIDWPLFKDTIMIILKDKVDGPPSLLEDVTKENIRSHLNYFFKHISSKVFQRYSFLK